ncbi:SpoIIE family protein phosphatase [Streptomyces sp. NPDC051776]|uniref:SpoIIE family protein phosphatase n=1 Tax=Streptomyces sp. NPDC051776 TaxID=3155414 RepID=UPI00343D802F
MCPHGSGGDGADPLLDKAAAALSADSTEQVLRQVLGGTSAGIAILDTRLRFLYVNPAFAAMAGIPAAGLVGHTLAEVAPGIESRTDVLREVLADGKTREAITSGRTRHEPPYERRWWHGAYHRLEAGGRVTGIVGVILEVTGSQRQQRELEQARERLALLDAAATRIGTALDMDMTCAQLADFLVPLLADMATVEVLPTDEPEGRPLEPHRDVRLRRAALAVAPELRGAVPHFGRAGDFVAHPPGSTAARCLVAGQPVLQNLQSEEELSRSAPEAGKLAAYRAAGIHSTLVVPLAGAEHPIGTVSLARSGDSPAFTDEDVVITQDLARRAAIGIGNARRYARSQGIALELQRALLAEPGSPHPNIEFASRYLPSGSSALVGGDWYETVRLSFGRTLLVMGDVMGHGVEAAVDMSYYRSTLRYVSATDLPPHRILRQLDATISGSESARPATCLLALADPARGLCSFASAGHLPPARILPDGTTELIDLPNGPPLGTGFGGYEPVTLDFTEGQVLLLYTDGLVERRGEDIDTSLERLAALRLPVTAGVDEILDEVLRRMAGEAAEDDVAVLAARVRPPSGPGTEEA